MNKPNKEQLPQETGQTLFDLHEDMQTVDAIPLLELKKRLEAEYFYEKTKYIKFEDNMTPFNDPENKN